VRICTGGAHGDHPLEASGHELGVFSAIVPSAAAGDDYWFLLDDDHARPDPVSRWQPAGVHGPSRVVDPRAFSWTDEGWRGVSMDDLVIYELHVGTFTTEGTFAAIIPRLPALKAFGITAIEVMPAAQFPGARNWGYDGVSMYAVQNSYGGPVGFAQLVDAAHATGLGVILDVVYNHVGPEGSYLDAFGPYFTDAYRTPWGRALNYDGADSDEVRRFVVDNARFWIDEYHVDGLRLDAVHAIYDSSARHLLAEIGDAVRAHALDLGRSVVVIAESDLNDPKLVRSRDEHGFGLDAQWSDDLHHAIHSMLTGERAGYYADFGGVSTIAAALREPFVLDGRYSRFRRRTHGAPSTGVPRRRFVVAMQNHDQVGNRAAGDRLSTILSAAQLRLAAVLIMLSPYVPLLFMGEEYGETSPFHYFVSHGDSRLVDDVRAGRKSEFESFGWTEPPDPQAEGTYEASKIDWTRGMTAPQATVLSLYRDLLALRREEPMLRPDRSRLTIDTGGSGREDGNRTGWISVLRQPVAHSMAPERDSTTALLALFNCSPTACHVPLASHPAHTWTLRLSSDAAGYGGDDAVARWNGPTVATDAEPIRLLGNSSRAVQIPPWTAAVFSAVE
jgi:maltooligosyltrehalose trehalohydrolase